MDAFYASVEQRDNDDFKGKPLVVGSRSERGVIAAASYEARKFGVRSAMPSSTALKKCPELIFVKPRIDYYKTVSKEIMNIFHEYTNLVEPLSLDEAFLDVTENSINQPSATLLAKELKEKIHAATQLNASAGVSYNKFLAKIASDVNKPNGLFVIPPEKAIAFIDTLEIRKFFGIGKVGAQKMLELGIKNGADLRTKDKAFLAEHFGKNGLYFYDIARGIDNRPVNPNRERKSVGAEQTFQKDVIRIDEVFNHLESIANECFRRLEKTGKMGKTITLKIRYSNFETITKSKTFSGTIASQEVFRMALLQVLKLVDEWEKPIRLLGVSVSNFDEDGARLNI